MDEALLAEVARESSSHIDESIDEMTDAGTVGKEATSNILPTKTERLSHASLIHPDVVVLLTPVISSSIAQPYKTPCNPRDDIRSKRPHPNQTPPPCSVICFLSRISTFRLSRPRSSGLITFALAAASSSELPGRAPFAVLASAPVPEAADC